MRGLLLVLVAGCSVESQSNSEDLRQTHPDDLSEQPNADAAEPEDMTVELPDLLPLPDMVMCGASGQPCCGAACNASLFCMYYDDICVPRQASVCVPSPNGCGSFSQSCCGADGTPNSIGYCPAPYRCKSGTCQSCP